MLSNEEIYLLASLYVANGLEVDDVGDPFSFLTQNINDMVSLEAIDDVYQSVLDASAHQESTSNIVALLVTDYINKHDDTDFLVKFFAKANYTEAINLFYENDNFAYALIRSYYTCLIKEPCYYEKNKNIASKYSKTVSVSFLPNEVRHRFSRLFSTLNLGQKSEKETTKLILMILNSPTVVKGSAEIAEDIDFLKSYQTYLYRLMYADVYADLINKNLFDSESSNIAQTVRYAILNSDYWAPMDFEDAAELFKYFVSLANSEDVRRANHDRLIKHNNDRYKKLNPLWMIDKSDIIVKRSI